MTIAPGGTGRPALRGLPRTWRAAASLLPDAMGMAALKLLAKALMLGYVVTVASWAGPELFGDFQFLAALLGLVIQPAVLITWIIAQLGCGYSPESQRAGLRWLLGRSLPWALLGSAAAAVGFVLLAGEIAHLADLHTVPGVWLTGLAVAGNMLLLYVLGFFVALERFWVIGALLAAAGLVHVAAVALFMWVGSESWGVFAPLPLGFLAAVAWGALILRGQLSSPSRRPAQSSRSHIRRSLPSTAAIGVFFVIFNLDILAVKFFFNATQAGNYARLLVLGKVVFIVVSNLGWVVFPRLSKGRGPAGKPGGRSIYLRRTMALALLPGVVLSAVLWQWGAGLLAVVIGPDFAAPGPMLALILAAATLAGLLFVLLNFAVAAYDRWPLLLLAAVLVGLAALTVANHDRIVYVPLNMCLAYGVALAALWARLRRRQNAPEG